MASGSIKKRKNKSGTVYVARWRDHNKEEYKKTFKKRKDAEAHLAKVQTEVNDGTYQPLKNITFISLSGKWLELKKSQIRPKTYKSYKAHIERLNSAFGKRIVKNITALDVESFVAGLTNHKVTNRYKEARALSPTSIGKTVTILKSMLNAAIR